jgi:putative PIN family toxin of toxin-antitoxin system
MTNKRFVIDTNILISSVAFANSPPDQALRKALADGILVFSRATIEEFKEVLFRPKFDRYISQNSRRTFFFEIVTSALVVEAKPCSVICRDSKDQIFLELLAKGDVDTIISGDQDLLILEGIGNCQIISPSRFLGI